MVSRLIVYLWVGSVFLGGVAQAAPFTCTAQVTIHQFKVTVDPQAPRLTVATDTGSHYDGSPAVSYSAQSGDTDYFLATGFGVGFDVDVENGGQHRIALCLSPSECYLCR
jgi:hypothetical protein